MAKQNPERRPTWRDLRTRTQKLIGIVGLHDAAPEMTPRASIFTANIVRTTSESIELYDGKSISFSYFSFQTILGSTRLAEVTGYRRPLALRAQLAAAEGDSTVSTTQPQAITKGSYTQSLVEYDQHLAAAEEAVAKEAIWNDAPPVSGT